MKTGEPISMHTEFEQVAPALQLLKLYKRFGEFIAVNHIDLVVPRGSFTELLGLMEQGKLHLYRWPLVCYDQIVGAQKFLELMFGVIQNKLKH
ncbi:hypothetical protein ACT7C3_11735 [Bacillus pacificus]